ncbi:MAG: DUF6600 domain-containing protein [Chthoniobacterales bacterium]
MKRNFLLLFAASLTLGAVACQKQASDAERNAEVERQVQDRLAVERQADEQQNLAGRQADLDARERALATRENSATATATPEIQESTPVPIAAADTDDDSYDTFYRKLEPYGDWMETGDYGYVFQPRQATQSHDWRPYTNGHWVYTDAGWTWISDEKFGWATYHYGRWVRLRSVGWVWVPGEQWAPAWVSWRKGGDYVGWAPLPPEAQFDRQTGIQNWADNYYDIGPDQYAFVPAKEFGRQLTSREVVPTERNVTLINQTINVTNIVYKNSVIVDRGPSYDDLRSGSGQSIKRYRLERTRNVNNETPVFRGEIVALPTADFRPPQVAVRPARVTRTIAQPVVERGWAEISDRQAADKARTKMKTEATPPPNLPPKRFVRPVPKAQPQTAVTAAPSPRIKLQKKPMHTPVPKPNSSPRKVIPPAPAVKQIGSPAPTVTPAPSVTPATKPSPTTAVAPSDAMQPSPAENVFSPKAADRNRRQKEQQEKRKARQEAQAQRQAEQQQKMQEQRGQGRETPAPSPATTPESPADSTTPSPAATEASPTESNPPSPTESNPPSSAEGKTAAERRQARQEKRRARRGEGPKADASATPSSTP